MTAVSADYLKYSDIPATDSKIWETLTRYARSVDSIGIWIDGTKENIVKTATIFGGAILLMALAAVSSADDDPKYPAYHFEPKVIVPAAVGAAEDISVKAESPQADSRYPAAYFEPKVIYQDKESIDKLQKEQ
ncbi:hypothetical protein [Methylocaldum sp.]|uniref:hypothetical protein n=1 Tax=Methylocaldum sp. TaxID=1969727 RepID=UPI002D35B03D|nr:hypothetical protein [Methylocaldum sp.]HYE36328.1 hypothetical protein [Methylocaldum sp.]